MDIYANGKNIPTYLFGNLFIQGEKFADVIRFHIDRYHNGIDLINCNFCIRGLTEDGWEVQQTLIPQTSFTERTIILEWKVSDSFTYNSGKLALELRASIPSDEESEDDDSIIIKYNMPDITVKPTISGNNGILPETAEQALSEINQAVTEGLQEIQDSISDIDIDGIKERMTAIEDKLNILLARPEVIPVTREEYAEIQHLQNALYIITEGAEQ